MPLADLYIALWLLPHCALSPDYTGENCLNGSTAPLCSVQISSGNLPLFDGNYPLPPAQGFPDWFFSYQDRTTHGTAPPASYTDSSKAALDSATPSIFTVSPDPSPAQIDRFEACHDKAS